MILGGRCGGLLIHSSYTTSRGTTGSAREERRVRTQSRVAWPANLARVNAAARKAVQTRFTALLHHIDLAAFERAFWRQKRAASAGVDGITMTEYERNLQSDGVFGRVVEPE